MVVEEGISSPRVIPAWLLYTLAGLLLLITAGYLAHWGRRDGLDLQVYRAAITAWRSGHDPYAGRFTAHHLPFTYPPFSLLALSPLSWAPFGLTQIILWIVTLGSLAGAAYVVAVRSGRGGGRALGTASLAWAGLAGLIVEPVRSTLDYGQVDTLLLGLVVVDLLVVPRGRRGLLIGLAAAIKLTPLIFLVLPLLERDWKTLGRGVAAGAASTGLMWVLWPKVAWTFWTRDVFDARRVGNIAYAGNQSLYGDLHRWPFPSSGVTGLWLAWCGVTALAGVALAARCVADDRRVAAMLSLALTGLLISPVSWTHHWVWVALLPPILLHDHHHVPIRLARTMLWVLFTLSVAAPYWWFSRGMPSECLSDSLSLWAFATLIAWSWREHRVGSPAHLIATTAGAAGADSLRPERPRP
jgi:alpha-1,2-mannosyltransferase